ALVAEAEAAEALRRQVAENKARALAAFEAAPNGDDPYLAAARQDYHRLGGFARLGKFSAWLAAVAETGDLEATAADCSSLDARRPRTFRCTAPSVTAAIPPRRSPAPPTTSSHPRPASGYS